METNKILNSDILDIIFDGRNKQYGAYELRKTYNRRLTYALSAMLGISLLAIASGVLANAGSSKSRTFNPVIDITLTAVNTQKDIPPVIPPPVKELQKVEIKKFTELQIVKEEVKEDPPKNTDLDEAKIGVINQKGIAEDIVAAPVEKSTGAVAPLVAEPDINHEFRSVQIQASFPGGFEEWKRFLERNLKQEVPVDNGAPAGKYPVMVSFLVDRDGNVTQVKAETDPGYGTAAEAVRVIQRSGKWTPAVQNGRNVIYRQREVIIFQVEEGQ